jgi:hypothetical protein
MSLALATLLAATSGAVDCKALDRRANSDGAFIPGGEAIHEVVGTGRLPFYSAPDARCAMPGVFVIPKDEVIAHVDYGGYTLVMFINLKTGTDTEGWVLTSRLRATGKGISPPQAVEGSATVVGDWCAREEGKTSFQDFSLQQKGDEHSFSSFLHLSPEHTGTWKLDGRNLTIRTAQETAFEFKVLSATEKEIQLLSEDGRVEHYFKDKCASSSDPFRPGASTTTRYGVVEWASNGEESGRASILVDGETLRSFEADVVELTRLENAPPNTDFVLVELWKGALNCHTSFAVVELRQGTPPRISEEFGECTELDGARIESDGVRVDASETVGGKDRSFWYVDGHVRDRLPVSPN